MLKSSFLAFLLIFDMFGYAFGPGNAEEKLVDFEKIHHTYITADDLNEVENLER